ERIGRPERKGLRWAVLLVPTVILLAWVGWWLFRGEIPSVAPGEITSIAVLPLDNLMGDPEQDYFVDGMHEALITDLSKIGALKIISRTSVMRYKERNKSVPEIARELGVDAVVEGSVLRAGNRVRITAQLIHGTTDEHLWAESYQHDLSDILALQSEVARAIAQEIQIKLTPEEQQHLASVQPVNPEAHEAYLRGRYYWNKRSREGFKKGLDYFQQAAEIDPDYALAHAGLADSYILLAASNQLRPHEAFPKAREAVTKALAINETLAEAHASLARILSDYDWNWTGAERELKRALELNPGYAMAHTWYGEFLSFMGRHEEAIAEAKKARELDPLSLVINAFVGTALKNARRYDEAIEQYNKTLELDPNYGYGRRHLIQSYLHKGMFEEAITLLRERPGSALLGCAYAMAGQREEALRIVAELEQVSKERYVSGMPWLYTALGDKDRAFEWLERAYNRRYRGLISLRVQAMADPLRSDPRFQDLLRRMGLEP
ncbi:tetratricopeptide repeat protein, partial [Acidobacteria bacterium AH-259-G07]|nr:tetratricopeptide repeat protein [Acidobacteria bacterium AH-259-G07]